MGGMIARLTAAARQASPTTNKVRGVCSLFAIFILLRTPSSVLQEVIRHQTVRVPHVYRSAGPLLRRTVGSDDYLPLVKQAERFDPRIVE